MSSNAAATAAPGTAAVAATAAPSAAAAVTNKAVSSVSAAPAATAVADEIPRVVFVQVEGNDNVVVESLREECERLRIKNKVTKVVDLQNQDTTHQVAFHNCDLAILDLRTVDNHNSSFISFHIGRRLSRNTSPHALTVILLSQRVTRPIPNCTYYYYKLREGNCFADTEDQPPLAAHLSHLLRTHAETQPTLQTQDLLFQDGIAKASSPFLDRTTKLEELKKLETILKDKYSDDRLHDILSCYRDLKEWRAMIRLADAARNEIGLESKALLAFALNRRNEGAGKDRTRAMHICDDILQRLKVSNNSVPDPRKRKLLHDTYGLIGRIHKDAFVDSLRAFMEGQAVPIQYDSCDKAIEAYGQICQIEEEEAKETGKKNNFYGAINLLTLMFCSRDNTRFEKRCCELSAEISHAYGMSDFQPAENAVTDNDYWALANVLEANLVGYYITQSEGELALALIAIEKMQDTSFQPWMAETTVKNLRLLSSVVQHRRDPRRRKKKLTADVAKIEFWQDFLEDCGSECTSEYEWRVLYAFTPQQKQRPEPARVRVQMATDAANAVVQVFTLEAELAKQPPVEIKLSDVKNIGLLTGESDSRTAAKASRTAELIIIREDNKYERIFLVFPSSGHRAMFHAKCEERGYRPTLKLELQPSANAKPVSYEYTSNANGQRKVLGQGASATVYEGINRDNNQMLAIKVFEDGLNEALIRTEMRYAQEKLLQHRNIVHIFGFVREATGTCVLLMELVPGGCIADLVRYFGGLLRFEPWLKCYAAQLVEAVSYLHNLNIMHRDIKGDNVLVNTYTGVVKLADFNVAQTKKHYESEDQGIAGAVHFMAPEVLDGQAGKPSDIWSLGCTVWQMVTGDLPYPRSDATVFECMATGNSMTPEVSDSWNKDLKDFFDKCFQKDAALRPTAEQLKAHPFIHDNEQLANPDVSLSSSPSSSQPTAASSASSTLHVPRTSSSDQRPASPRARSRAGSIDESWAIHHERIITQSVTQLLSRDDVITAWEERLKDQQLIISLLPGWRAQLPVLRDFLLQLLKADNDGDVSARSAPWRVGVRATMRKWCRQIQADEETDDDDATDAPHWTRQLMNRGVENMMRDLYNFKLNENRKLSFLIPFMKEQSMKPHWVFFISRLLGSKCRMLQEEMAATVAVYFDAEGKRTAASVAAADDTDDVARPKRMREKDFASSMAMTLAMSAQAPTPPAMPPPSASDTPVQALIKQQMLMFDQWQAMAQNAKQMLLALHHETTAPSPPRTRTRQLAASADVDHEGAC
ncbi:STE/STE11 protein kinase [Salpingoeca rosetta]|uniref:STE/STE11 protein kinase n=1 Tax=Salpingoeca rosetta (strain ATCC 50818 / BSB-021) TaxID=946362 RepID=F2USG5_SALR5|nr:STE/STE11 protein kinase [Salpingoeca rosetta]EGD81074.1 STE/STE11 protein kinase [Salpingoeca rosetta]|eukprot:XP_004987943.1 STE/STE11 protein kinase [Salpingoeca rosetta]